MHHYIHTNRNTLINASSITAVKLFVNNFQLAQCMDSITEVKNYKNKKGKPMGKNSFSQVIKCMQLV